MLADDSSALTRRLPRAVRLDGAIAFRWRRRGITLGSSAACWSRSRIRRAIAFDDLQDVESQKDAIQQNTRQFVAGQPANNVLLTGARGTGKSSLIKACLQRVSRRRACA